MSREPVEFADAPSEESPEAAQVRYSEVVLHATDWTTETVVAQLKRENILLSPRFQRRDAWSKQRKSQFVESLILGLPIPQIVLAESKEHRGRFMVLDGKQRLLSIMQFWGLGEGANNSYRLTGLDVREDLAGKNYSDLETNKAFVDDYNALLNQPIRTVIIKNWPDSAFLHLVFLRLNTGSVKLSPQELRQALFPGEFTNFVDDRACASSGLRDLLGLEGPDYRMRDVELLARHLAFHFFLDGYKGRMKEFLDGAFSLLNNEWAGREQEVKLAADEFDVGIASLMELFPDGVGRKSGSRQLNRAILDALLFYAIDPRIRVAAEKKKAAVQKAYADIFDNAAFVAAIERDTAGIPNTALRLKEWGDSLRKATGLKFKVPELVNERIAFNGFWG